MTTSITKTAFFNVPRETVWSYLTDKDKLAEWYYPAMADLAPGDDYCLYALDEDGTKVTKVSGAVLVMEAPSKLVTSFVIAPFGSNSTTVTWLLEEAAGGTRLHLSHEGIAEASGDAAMQLLMALDDGWDKHIAALRGSVNAG